MCQSKFGFHQRNIMLHMSVLFFCLLTSTLYHGMVTNQSECFFAPWLGTLSCCGLNATYFPDFEESVRYFTGHIDIINTTFTTLPVLNRTEWPRLMSVEAVGNKKLPCGNVDNFKILHPQLILLSDCNILPGAVDLPTENSREKLEYLATLCIVTPFFGLLLLRLKKLRGKLGLPHRETVSRDLMDKPDGVSQWPVNLC